MMNPGARKKYSAGSFIHFAVSKTGSMELTGLKAQGNSFLVESREKYLFHAAGVIP